jgi:ornithine cyclodeaminase/alanine dehydrogenase-like protein (mu-crystallin family)
VLALIDSAELTARRTAAATGVAIRHLAADRAVVATIAGCGVQAPAQIEALAAVRDVQRVFAYDVDPARAEAFASHTSRLLGLEVRRASDFRDAVAQSDVCITCTTSREYILDADDVHDGMLVAGVGVDNENKRELTPALLARARVVTDLTAQCLLIGDLHHAVGGGALTAADVYAEIGQIAGGQVPGRTHPDELFVFDSTGIALQDVAAAASVYEQMA